MATATATATKTPRKNSKAWKAMKLKEAQEQLDRQQEEAVTETPDTPQTVPTATPEELFSDAPTAETEPVDVPENAEEVSETKESRMSILAHSVPGKVALATLTPDKLKALAFVSTYNTVDAQSSSPRQHGYQREPMAARFPGIGRYYAKPENQGLITPIIASARVYDEKEQARFNFLFNRGETSKILAEFGNSVFSIIDGQHRMGGLFWAWENMADFNADVPVMIFYGLHYAEEATLFDDINTNQRKLPKALIEATKVHMESGEKTHQQQIREIAFALAQDGDSVWHGLVNMTGARDPEKPVTYEGLRRATSNMMHERLINRLEARRFSPEETAKKYWELVARASDKAWNNRPRLVETADGEQEEEPVKYRLKDLVGVAAISRLGADILNTAIDKSKTEEDFWSAVADQVSRLGAIDWEKTESNPWMRSGAGFAGMGKLYSALYDLVYLDKSPGEAVAPDE